MCHEFCKDCPLIPESHTTKEWAELPDKVSVKNKWYAVTDYRTDNDVNIPRFKFGDGVTMISKLPFVTAAITDNTAQTQYIVNRVAPYPIPAYTVANPVTPATT